MNQNWNRWVYASCVDYFESNKGDYNLCIDNDRVDKNEYSLWADLAIIGATISKLTYTTCRLNVTIMLVLTDIPNDQDAYRLRQMTGYFSTLMEMIPIYRYGLTAEPENDDTLLGCLQLDGPIEINNFGEPSPDTKLMQATVRANFRMYLEGDN